MDPNDLKSRWRESRDLCTPDWSQMERRLLAAFDEHREAPAHGHVSLRRWSATAAAVAAALAITFYIPSWRHITPPAPPSEAPRGDSAAVPAETPPPRQNPSPPARPRPRVPRAAPAPAQAPEPWAASSSPAEFVPLPGSSALPALESGRIVRVEVPLAALPAYGIDMVPDAAPGRVQADVLIGQDGLPRAIRLASASTP